MDQADKNKIKSRPMGVEAHAHQLKDLELPQNEKMSFFVIS